MDGFQHNENRSCFSNRTPDPTPNQNNAGKATKPLTPLTFLITGPGQTSAPLTPGFPTQIRSSLPGATPKSRLTCGFLNKLQHATFQPTSLPVSGLFSSILPQVSYRSTFTRSTATAHACGMSDLPHFQRIEMTVSTCAITDNSYRCYRVLALCEAYDSSGKVITFSGFNGARGFMSVSIVHDWCRHVDNFKGIEDSDGMSWDELVIVLRDVAKLSYSRYGEVRRLEDRLRLNSE